MVSVHVKHHVYFLPSFLTSCVHGDCLASRCQLDCCWCFYIALFSALEQTHCARGWKAFLNIHRSGVLTTLAWLVPRETAAVSAQVLCTPYNHAPCHFMQSHRLQLPVNSTGSLQKEKAPPQADIHIKCFSVWKLYTHVRSTTHDWWRSGGGGGGGWGGGGVFIFA